MVRNHLSMPYSHINYGSERGSRKRMGCIWFVIEYFQLPISCIWKYHIVLDLMKSINIDNMGESSILWGESNRRNGIYTCVHRYWLTSTLCLSMAVMNLAVATRHKSVSWWGAAERFITQGFHSSGDFLEYDRRNFIDIAHMVKKSL